jgi:drug/metabolite transporter (DMT)-like permease
MSLRRADELVVGGESPGRVAGTQHDRDHLLKGAGEEMGSINTYTLANLAAATAALSAGASVVATRLLVGETDPVTLAFYRYVIAAGCLAPVVFVRCPRAGIPCRDLATLAALGALFFGLFPWAFSASLYYTTAARGAIGLATIPIQTLMVAVCFGRETLTRNKILSVSLTCAGIVVAIGSAALHISSIDQLMGDSLMLIGALCAALYSVFSRRLLQRYNALFVTAAAMVSGVFTLFPLAAMSGAVTAVPAFTSHGWFALLFLGTLGGAMQFALFTWALRWLPPSRTVIYLALNPIAAMFLATVLLGEAITIMLIIGLGLVLSGIFVTNRPGASEVSTTEGEDVQARVTRHLTSKTDNVGRG